ncbi:hypothetical protein QCA50_016707 [Cerrena zonata]|uniref:Uncharacterized protein n=1 Tax=Cerrena zonata TaxID=2478898 RepID=A0AAW0FES5_9APHY
MEYSVERPTLPPLESLCLPSFNSKSISLPPVDARDNFKFSNFESIAARSRMRQASTSSMSSESTITSCTPTLSRSCSPSSSDEGTTTSSTPKHPHIPSTKFTLIQSTFDEADAFVVVPPPTSENASSKGFLLVGPTAEKLRRNRDWARAKNARIHPYRMVPGHTASRRASFASTMSS